MAVYFEALVGGLMLIDTGARLRVSPSVLEAARKAAQGGPVVGAGDSRLGYADTTPQQIVDQINAVNEGCDPKVIYKDWIADDCFDVTSRLAQIVTPALAICGDEDPLTPLKYHEFLRDKMPACQLVSVPNAGHWPFAENPEAFDHAVLEFLERL